MYVCSWLLIVKLINRWLTVTVDMYVYVRIYTTYNDYFWVVARAMKNNLKTN